MNESGELLITPYEISWKLTHLISFTLKAIAMHDEKHSQERSNVPRGKKEPTILSAQNITGTG